MERIARMSRMHASRVFFVRCSDRRNKKTKQTKRRKNFGLSREKEREMPAGRDQNLNETRWLFDHHRGRQILTLKLISDDDD
jgi:hypothetical protein